MSRLSQAVAQARASKTRLRILGENTKQAWIPALDGEPLNVPDLAAGVIDYQPEELVVTVFGGTPIQLVVDTLAEHNQCFAFEPPTFNGGGTIGGMIATGFGGPARKWGGSVRDAVLGVEMVNGKAEALRFGGQVMKNVAGYDVSRLVAGSFGSLGVIEAASLRVHPKTQTVQTLTLPSDLNEALTLCSSLRRQYLPLSGTWWHDGQLHLRLSGTEEGVSAARDRLGGALNEDHELWRAVRDQTHSFYNGHAGADLFRVIVPPSVPGFGEGLDQSFEWGGGLRWIWHEDGASLKDIVRSYGGWVWQQGAVPEITAGQRRLMQALKSAFDPDGIFVDPLASDAPTSMGSGEGLAN
ncbi:MAG: glycolate oxidase subunit GlcE [Pseudomonadota bacterium]